MKLYTIITVCLTFVSILYTSSFAAVPSETKQTSIAVMPFTIKAEKNLDYLKKALPQLVASRLYKKDQITIIPFSRQATPETTDYLFQGTLTQDGRSLSIAAEMKSGETTETFQVNMENAESEGQIVPLINRLCAQINTKLFGTAMREQEQTTGKETDLYNIHLHPDHLINQLDLEEE